MVHAVKALHLEDIIEALREYNPDADVDMILAAYAYASKAHRGQTRLSGEPYLSHPMQVAYILTRLHMDPMGIAAAILHDTMEDTDTTAYDLESIFGKNAAHIVEGLTKLSKLRFTSREERQAETMRKMILAMSDDIRVILIKLADRIHNLRTLEYLKPDRQKAIAEESMDIYAPLANRLGIGWLKSEMENLSFMYLHPNEYRRLASLVKERQKEVEKFAQTMASQTQEILTKAQVSAHVTARPKQIYSIYKKMQEQNLEFDQIYDIIGVRVITNSKMDCYKVLGAVHERWKPIPGKFKDYVALPKENMYQSIHTTVLSNTGRFVEFQIRTQQMHRNAEDGIAAHWRYKEKQEPGKDAVNFLWMRRLMELGHAVDDSREFLKTVKADLFPEEVYIFTPKQEVMAFPTGATPIDFAYAVHTQVGNNCVGARVNGKPVPLSAKLRNGDVVRIITSPDSHPKREWLKFAKTTTAQTKIRAYIRNAQKSEARMLGRELVEEELKKYGLDPKVYFTEEALAKSAEAMGFKSPDMLLQRLGFFRIPVDKYLQKLLPAKEWQIVQDSRSRSLKDRISRFMRPRQKLDVGVRVQDMGNMMMRIAGCCNPVPGDSIFGYATKGHGLVIHNKSCPVLREIDPEPDRLIEAQWEKPKTGLTRPVRIIVYSVNKPGLLANVSTAIAECHTNISNAVIAPTDAGGGELDLTVEIEDLRQLRKVMDAVSKVPGVKKVERFMEGVHTRPVKV